MNRKAKENHVILSSSWIETPLGAMLAISDDEVLYLLEFAQTKGLEREIERLKKNLGAVICSRKAQPIDLIEKELNAYFLKELFLFKTPLFLMGSEFQKSVWDQLMKIPAGQTRSYRDIAIALGRPTAFRAVALANSLNRLAIVIPCHRVIKTDGSLCGYAGGVARKQWLLGHETAQQFPLSKKANDAYLNGELL